MIEQMRTTKTEHYLLEALIELTRWKDIQKIRVRELCAKAQINRTTFYKHYENMPDFLQHITQNFITQMNAHLQAYLNQENMFMGILDGNAEVVCFYCVEFMQNNIDFMRMMLGPHGSLQFQQSVIALWVRDFKSAVMDEMPHLHEDNSINLLANYVVSAIWGLLCYIVLQNTKYTPEYLAQQMSFLLYDCTLKPLMESQMQQ